MVGGVVVSNENFYVRSHFPVPALDAGRWRLRVVGLVKKSLAFSLADLLNMPSRTAVVTLECAGNGRSTMQPPVDGEQWALGAAGTAEWTGVPLHHVLRQAGIKAGAREVVFRGADRPAEKLSIGPARFERSLVLADSLDDGPLLAYAMNGEPLPAHHGYPVRLIVPGWYAVASVKWLTEIDVIGRAFEGYFQTEKYIYEWDRDGDRTGEPVRHLRVRSLITHPTEGAAIRRGRLALRGLAWSGVSPIANVEVSVGGGSWRQAQMLGDPSRTCWQRWELMVDIERPGKTTLRSRATDGAGRTQPETPEWNRLGYGNNAIQKLTVTATRAWSASA